MHHPTDRITHTTAFVTPVVEHWLEREIAQWVHPMKDRSDDPSHHERTLHLWATSRSHTVEWQLILYLYLAVYCSALYQSVEWQLILYLYLESCRQGDCVSMLLSVLFPCTGVDVHGTIFLSESERKTESAIIGVISLWYNNTFLFNHTLHTFSFAAISPWKIFWRQHCFVFNKRLTDGDWS